MSSPEHPLNLSFPPKPVIVSLCDVPTRSSLPCVPFGFLLVLLESIQTEDGNGRGGCSLFGGGGDFTVIEMTPIFGTLETTTIGYLECERVLSCIVVVRRIG